VSFPIELKDADLVSQMLQESEERPVLVYKHSVSCPISGYAWHEVQNCLDLGDEAPACYRVTVQYHPDLSRDIALMLDVIHHTPQVIVVRKGKASYVASHWQIKKQTLQRALMDGPQLPENS
jgi:bacillithiol system protein YtxJ